MSKRKYETPVIIPENTTMKYYAIHTRPKNGDFPFSRNGYYYMNPNGTCSYFDYKYTEEQVAAYKEKFSDKYDIIVKETKTGILFEGTDFPRY